MSLPAYALSAFQPADLPPETVATPAFVIYEDRLRHNLQQTIKAAGGPGRFVPHLKTHRAPWIVALLVAEGIDHFKAATSAELIMAAEAGAKRLIWAYPEVARQNIRDFVAIAKRFPEVAFTAVLDSDFGWQRWEAETASAGSNISLRIDLDPPGFGRSGISMDDAAVGLARKVATSGRFAGWHLYDGFVRGSEAQRRQIVDDMAQRIRALNVALFDLGPLTTVAGCSYTFDIWPADVAQFVSTGSWTYSSSQHDDELGHLGWHPAAAVLATVMSVRGNTATLDAGCKAIAPDKPLATRFRWPKPIRLMNEEHVVVEAEGLQPGDRVLLLPQHACTTAYLYDRATVQLAKGGWASRAQLGSHRYHAPD